MAELWSALAERAGPAAAAGREGLTALAGLYAHGNGPTDAILALHCLYCAAVLRMPELHAGGHRWLLSFWAVFAGAFGGGTLTALLMMRPDVAPLPAFVDARLLPYIAAAWYFVHYTRLGAWLLGLLPIRFLCRLATTCACRSPPPPAAHARHAGLATTVSTHNGLLSASLVYAPAFTHGVDVMI